MVDSVDPNLVDQANQAGGRQCKCIGTYIHNEMTTCTQLENARPALNPAANGPG
jgi:hypothetical protein